MSSTGCESRITLAGPNPVQVVTAGIVTPLGLSLLQTDASLRARLSRVQESHFVDLQHRPLRMGLVDFDRLPYVDESIHASIPDPPLRGFTLGALALKEAVSSAGLEGTRVDVILSLNEHTSVSENMLRYWLQIQSGFDLGVIRTPMVTEGRASAFPALASAIHALSSGLSETTLVAGFDSYAHYKRLTPLMEAHRIATEVPGDGFIPGEGAGAIVLARADDPGSSPTVGPQARVLAVATAAEPSATKTTVANLGEGLTSCFGALFEALPALPKIRAVFSSMNGETRWAREWAASRIRYADRFADNARVEHPAEGCGDLGAASGTVLLGLVAHRLRSGMLRGPVMVWAASDGGCRGAAILDA